MAMDFKHAINRGNNLLVTAFLVAVAISLLGDLPQEHEFIDHLDEILIILTGVGCLVWYLLGQHRYELSLIPLGLLALALIFKIIAVAIEIGDATAIGDDFGLLPAILVMLIISSYVVIRARKEV
jgi:hypothetical protein